MPTWIVLLALFPLTGLGVLPCLLGATLVTAAVIVVADRRRSRRDAAAAPGAAAPRERRPMGALAGAGIALGLVVVLAYVVLVARAA